MMEEEDEEEDYRTFVGGYVRYALNDNLPEIISETPYFKPNLTNVPSSDEDDEVESLADFEGLENIRTLFSIEAEPEEFQRRQESGKDAVSPSVYPRDTGELSDDNNLTDKPEVEISPEISLDSETETVNTHRSTEEMTVEASKPDSPVTGVCKTKTDDTKENEDTGMDGKENEICESSPVAISSNSIPIKKSKAKENCFSEETVMRIIEKCQSDDAFILDISKQGLNEVPSAVFNLKDIKYLYLEGNGLCNLPESFFDDLPAVQWLDLRNNRLSSLPSSIGSHVNLVHLLIEGNRFCKLTPEIGLLTTLRGLNFRNNPLQDPPPEILALGLRETLYYLRQKLPIYNEGASSKASRSVLGTIKKRSGPFDPTRNCSLTSIRNNKNYNPGKSYDGPSLETLEAKAKADINREMQKLRKEHVDAIIQHIKNDLALKTWRDKARHQQLKYMSMFDERDFISPALQAPFDIDEEYLPIPSRKQLQQRENLKKKQRYEISPGYMDAARLSKEKELEKKIRTHLEKLQISSRDGNLDLDKAAQELRKVEQLQRELAQLFRPVL